MWQQYNQETHQKDPSNLITSNNYVNTVNEYYTKYETNNLNILQKDKFLMIVPQKHQINKAKYQVTFWIQ